MTILRTTASMLHQRNGHPWWNYHVRQMKWIPRSMWSARSVLWRLGMGTLWVSMWHCLDTVTTSWWSPTGCAGRWIRMKRWRQCEEVWRRHGQVRWHWATRWGQSLMGLEHIDVFNKDAERRTCAQAEWTVAMCLKFLHPLESRIDALNVRLLDLLWVSRSRLTTSRLSDHGRELPDWSTLLRMWLQMISESKEWLPDCVADLLLRGPFYQWEVGWRMMR